MSERPWRLARSLEQLRAAVDARAPARSRASDGTIGDRAHASRTSDHNPWLEDPAGVGVVTALDLTHDPAGGCDAGVLARALVDGRDPRIKYVIFDRRIASATVEPWVWRPYLGRNAHARHVHVSVSSMPTRYDSAAPWALPARLT